MALGSLFPADAVHHVKGLVPAIPARCRMSRWWFWLIVCSLWLVSMAPSSSEGQPSTTGTAAISVMPDLGLRMPRLRFHMGQSGPQGPVISPVLPDIPGSASAWYVTQWQQRYLLMPDKMTTNDPVTHDPRFGSALYAFTTPLSHLWIYQDPASGDFVYDLYQQDGYQRNGGGTNLYLSANAVEANATFDHRIDYLLDARMSAARATYDTAQAKQAATVIGFAASEFGVLFHDPMTNKNTFVFMGIPISSSRAHDPSDRVCLGEGHHTLIYGRVLRGDPRLPFAPDSGPLHHLSYNLNDYLCDMASKPFPCADGELSLPDSARDMSNWRLTGMFIGLESSIQDLRSRSTNVRSQGSLRVGLDVANVKVLRANDPLPSKTCKP